MKSSILRLFQCHVSFSQRVRVRFCIMISLLFCVKKPKLVQTSDRAVSYIFSLILIKKHQRISFAACVILLQKFSDKKIPKTFIYSWNMFSHQSDARTNLKENKQTSFWIARSRNINYASIAFPSERLAIDLGLFLMVIWSLFWLWIEQDI